jgi:molybdopterin converting factor small subunit
MPSHIQIKLYATLSRCQPPGADHYPISPGTTVQQLCQALAIPSNEVKLVFVNGVRVPVSQQLKDGDRVGLFPPVGGG